MPAHKPFVPKVETPRLPSRSSLVEPEYVQAAERLRIVGDPVRLKMLEILSEGPLKVTPMGERCGVAFHTASHHLCILRRAGVVECDRTYMGVLHWLTDDGRLILESVRSLIGAFSDPEKSENNSD